MIAAIAMILEKNHWLNGKKKENSKVITALAAMIVTMIR